MKLIFMKVILSAADEDNIIIIKFPIKDEVGSLLGALLSFKVHVGEYIIINDIRNIMHDLNMYIYIIC